MTPTQLSALLVELLSLPHETEWVEWKHNNDNPEMIAERISALANSAALHGRDFGYMVWGVEDGTKKVVGTNFRPRQSKKGNEELENWLMRSLAPAGQFPDARVVAPGRADGAGRDSTSQPNSGAVRQRGVHSHRQPDQEAQGVPREGARTMGHPSPASRLRRASPKPTLTVEEVLSLLDFDRCFELLQIPLPTDQQGILSKLAEEALIVPKPGGRFDITNLGAILFAKNLDKFERLGRKALRIIKYEGDGRTETEREWRDAPSQKGYAVAFEAAVAFINSQLPQNEPIGQAFRDGSACVPGEGDSGIGGQLPDPPGFHRDRGGADGRDFRQPDGDHQPRRAAGGHAAVHRHAAEVPQRDVGGD